MNRRTFSAFAADAISPIVIAVDTEYENTSTPVSYTHLTLPTNREV